MQRWPRSVRQGGSASVAPRIGAELGGETVWGVGGGGEVRAPISTLSLSATARPPAFAAVREHAI